MLYTFLFKFKAVDIIRFGEESHSGLVQRIANPRPVRGSWVRIPPPPHRLVWALASGEGWQNGNARVLKTRGRKPLEVRVLYPPPVRKCLCWLALCEGSPAVFRENFKPF